MATTHLKRVLVGLSAVAVLMLAACNGDLAVEWAPVRDASGHLQVAEDGTFEISIDASEVDISLEEFAKADLTFGPKNGGQQATGSRFDDSNGDGSADRLYLAFDLDEMGFERDDTEFVEQDACLIGDVADEASNDYSGCAALAIPPTGYVSPAPTSGGSGGGGGYHPPTAAFGTWAQRSPTSHPAGRDSYGLATDPLAGVVLFGGFEYSSSTSTSTTFDDTWRFNGAEWQELTPAADPGPRSGHAMAGDGTDVVLFGGYDDVGGIADDTWSWNGTTWAEVEDGTSGPAARTDTALAPYGDGQKYLLFGGDTAGTQRSDTWVWNGTSWTELTLATTPPARAGHHMALDPQSGDIILHGGYSATVSSYSIFADTWRFDVTTETWSQVTGSSPGSRSHAGMAPMDPAGPVVLFGGYDGSHAVGTTWIFDNGTWTQDTGTPAPSARSGHELALFDAPDDEDYALLFGGSDHGPYLADTWVYGD